MVCENCQGTGRFVAFGISVGPYSAICDCHQTCTECKGSGEGKLAFATGIGPYPTKCTACNGKGIVPKNKT